MRASTPATDGQAWCSGTGCDDAPTTTTRRSSIRTRSAASTPRRSEASSSLANEATSRGSTSRIDAVTSRPRRRACCLDVECDLRDEVGLALEGPLVAKPFPELDDEPRAVEIALEVEHEGLDP